MTWDSIQLGEVMDVKHGYAFKSQGFADSGDLILLTPGNCKESGGLKLKGDNEKYYVGEFPPEFLLSDGDMLVVMTDLINTAPILGGSFLIPENNRFLHNQRLGLVQVTDETRIDKTFLYYLLNTYDYRGQVRGSASGATVRHTSPSRIRGCTVRVPRDVAYQRQIGTTLFAYDDLIENNRRRMDLLDAAAACLYREWFIRLRFPGHEHTDITDGVPERWDRRPLASCVIFRSGGTPSKNRPEYWDGDIPWVSSGEMSETRLYDTPLHVSPEGADAGSRLVTRDTVLVVVRGMSLAKEFRLATVAREMAFNQDLKALECRDGIDPLFLFHSLIDQRDGIRDLATEASHGTKKLDTAVLERLPIVVAEPRLQRLFRDTVASSLAQRDNLYHQNVRLRAARDLLLPRLMDGRIAV